MFRRLVQKAAFRLGLLACLLVLPLLVGFGGSVRIWNWGPGLLACGLAVASLLCVSPARASWTTSWHIVGFVGVIAFLGWKATSSSILVSGAHDLVLMAIVLAGYLIGRAQDAKHSQALTVGLLAAVAGSMLAALIQLRHPEWNPVYPSRAGFFPSGFFSHYNHAASFGLGASGLFLSALTRNKGVFKVLSGCGLVASLLMVILSLSRGGNLALLCGAVLGFILSSANNKRTGGNSLLLWTALVTGSLLIVPLTQITVAWVAGFRGKVVHDGGFADGGRLSFYNAAWELFLERPITGGGPGSFGRDVYQVLPADFPLGAEPDMAHNELLQLLGDYGAPGGIALVLLLVAPILRQCAGHLLSRSSGGGVWESLGLVTMLIQSNFDFVFHIAPCAFLAALILGRISRERRVGASGSEWNQTYGVSRRRAEDYYDEARAAEASGSGHGAFIRAARGYACAFLAGRKRAELRLIVLLLSSQDEDWRNFANELVARQKIGDGKGMGEVVRLIVEKCGTGAGGPRRLAEKKVPEVSNRGDWATWLRKLAVAIVALAMTMGGIRLTRISLALWKPLYHPDKMTLSNQFESLLLIQEKAPFLGLERKMLAAFIDRLYRLSSLEAREFWASSSYRRIVGATVFADQDPVVALQVATVAGWAGDEVHALALYDKAISLQSVHERIFMARFFKAEYFQDLMLSCAAVGNVERSHEYAQLAAQEFRQSVNLAPYGGIHHQRRQELLAACDRTLSAKER